MRFLSVVCCVLFVGCNGDAGSPSDEGKTETKETAPDASSTGETVSLETRDWDALQELIASHRGKVVVVDFWSTTCDPCMREFPHLVDLHREYHEENVVCISVNIDYYGSKSDPPESFHADALEFLTEEHSTLTNILSSTDSDTIYEELDAAGIPVIQVYSIDGSLAKQFVDDPDLYEEGISYAKHVVPLVQSLLTAGS
ncbi:MAG: hypothetical protein CMJ48_11005 [Planctomycetaceae bacterium]|nr:hypothetical protein [Planctomycetaceae bacterium]